MVITFKEVIRSLGVVTGLDKTHKNGIEEIRRGIEGDAACG